MGLLDILNGMQNGPRGQRQPPSQDSGGGMSPMMMALLGLLAYKAFKGSGGLGNILGGGQPPAGRDRMAPPSGGETMQAGSAGGGLGDILGGLLGGKSDSMPTSSKPGSLADLLPGGLGGLLGGAAAGSVLTDGLGNLMKGLQDSGHGRTAQSWVGTGPNQKIEPSELESALGADTLDALSRQTGMARDDLLAGLSRQLPDFVDQLTPDGRLPSHEEASRMV